VKISDANLGYVTMWHTGPDGNGADVSAPEREIDEWVYALHGLRAEEIKIAEESAK